MSNDEKWNWAPDDIVIVTSQDDAQSLRERVHGIDKAEDEVVSDRDHGR